MYIAVVKNAIGGLDKLLSQGREALWDIEREVFGDPGYGEPRAYGYVDPRGALESFLKQLYNVLLVVLEAADMPEARASLVNAWPGFVKKACTIRTITTNTITPKALP